MRWIGKVAALALMVGAAAHAQTASEDPYIWLEEVGGARALSWVEAENQKTVTALQADPRYQRLYDDALAVLQARDRIPGVTFRAGRLYNFWQDATQVKGVIRRTTLDDYRRAAPAWESVLDIDALARAEGKSWVYKGMNCLPPEERRCLLSLSDGGRDSVVVREFDVVDRRFVEGGFTLPEGRNFVEWIDADTLLVARDWGPGTMTPSNYPIVVKSLRRGQPLAAARELFRGRADDVAIFPTVIRDTQGAVQAVAATRWITTFNRKTSLLRDGSSVELNLPGKADIIGAVAGRLLVSLDEAWTRADGTAFPAGSVVAIDLDRWKADPNRAPATLVWAVGPGQSLEGSALTAGRLIITYLDNVRGRAAVLTPEGNGWRTAALDLPANATLALGSADNLGERAFITVNDFLTPPSLYMVDSAAARVEPVKSSPARFDGSRHIIEQHSAVSRDGTKIPYFLVRPKGKPLDGTLPTLINGYGGFQVSQLPSYSGTLGKLWLEGGNGYVVANIRGGGEFGPAWHDAAIRATKQNTWDDYIAVAEDLVRRKISSPRRLGVVGGSQGGLLVGTAITQRPDLFRAAIVQVPLFDMLRYHLIGNGASWTGEYGDPTNPAERPWLAAYSPYQRLSKAQASIVPFIVTSAADDRVTPVHGRKAAARLAELGVPYYYFENREGGHAGAANQPEQARLMALEYVYAAQRLVD